MERYEPRPFFCHIRCTCRSSDFLLFAKNGFVVGVCSLKVTARQLNNAGCCYEYTIVSVPRIAGRYTTQCSLPNTHTAHIELDGGRQAGREGGRQRRSEEGWRMGGREQGEGGNKGRVGGRVGTKEHEGGWEGREGARGGNGEAMMIGRERASVEEGRVADGNERGRDGPRHGRREGKRGGGIEQEREGNFKGGILMRALARCIIGKPGNHLVSSKRGYH